MYRPFFFFVIALSSCDRSEKAEPALQGIITGSVSIPVKEDITLPPVAFRPDIAALRAPGDTNPVRMIAIGGSFPAGGRNGGLYREGQLTSIPILIAHQMQLTSFVTPLFSKEEGNGGGYLVYDRSATLPSWKRVENNLAIVSENPRVLSRYAGPEPIDNVSWPEGPGRFADSTNHNFEYPWRRDYYTYLHRIYNHVVDREWVEDYFVDSTAKTKPVHLLLRFEDLDFWIGLAAYSRNIIFSHFMHEGYFYPMRDAIRYNRELGRKQVLFNQPDYLDFPYFHLYNAKVLKAKDNSKGPLLDDNSLLMPNDNVKKAFSSKGIITLNDEDVLSPEEIVQRIRIINMLNESTYGWIAARDNLPLVDMYGLYKRILAGIYLTDDGFYIDPSFPDGNFFSDDCLRPTAIGSAVIANETIKVINSHYKIRIPLINVGEFARRL